jgi:hypothetical protein
MFRTATSLLYFRKLNINWFSNYSTRIINKKNKMSQDNDDKNYKIVYPEFKLVKLLQIAPQTDNVFAVKLGVMFPNLGYEVEHQLQNINDNNMILSIKAKCTRGPVCAAIQFYREVIPLGVLQSGPFSLAINKTTFNFDTKDAILVSKEDADEFSSGRNDKIGW